MQNGQWCERVWGATTYVHLQLPKRRSYNLEACCMSVVDVKCYELEVGCEHQTTADGFEFLIRPRPSDTG